MSEESAKPYYFVFDQSPEGRLLLIAGDGPKKLERADLDRLVGLGGLICLSGNANMPRCDGDRWALLSDASGLPDGYALRARRDLPALFGDDDYFIRSGVAYQMMNLTRRNKYCGVCGKPMTDHAAERARYCPACGNLVYPSLSPAVIVAVEREDTLLMGHGVNFPPGGYSVLAGFVEPGETLERAVEREVFEESRVRVKNIRYFGSQPWPFPNSMMIGFKADWASGDPAPGDDELTDVRWFSRGEVPDMPPSVSISRRLIDDWLLRKQGE
jgi:NAD+ diphosphatase